MKIGGLMDSVRIAVDVGGTFTDIALEHASEMTTAKVLTTPEIRSKEY